MAGLNAPVTPLGRPATERLIDWVEPLSAVVETVKVAVPPGATVALAGLSVMPKSGVVTTERVVMQSFCWFENSFWIVYVLLSVPTNVPCWPLQMSPISPLVESYQASGGPTTVARPTSASVIASISSCDDTEAWLLNVVELPQPVAQPDDGPMSGITP